MEKEKNIWHKIPWRWKYYLISLSCFIGCAVIVIFLRGNGFVRGYIGDVLFIGMLYFFIRGSILKVKPVAAGLFVITLGFAAEIMQLIHGIELFGIPENQLTLLLLGSVFDVKDLIAYFMGGLLSMTVDYLME